MKTSLTVSTALFLCFASVICVKPVSAQIVAPPSSAKGAVAPLTPVTPRQPIVPRQLPAPQSLGPSSTIGGNDPTARRLESTLPLDPSTRALQNQMPPNPGSVERQLGLRQPVGPVTDLRGHTPSPQEITHGLAAH